MNPCERNPRIDQWLDILPEWAEELAAFRDIVLGFPLVEDFKWGKPTYLFNRGMTVILFAFKDYCALGFFKGALLKDPEGILRSPGENSQAMRQIRVTSVAEIEALKPVIRAYVNEAIELEAAGAEIEFTRSTEFEYPAELTRRLEEDEGLKTAFEALTPGRRRAWCLFYSGAKQSKTRETRIEKSVPKIMDGKGPND